LRPAAERGNRTFSHIIGVQRIDDGEASALLLLASTRCRTRGRGRTAGAATAAAWRFFVIGFERETGCRAGARGFFRAKTLLGDFTGLAFCFLVVLTTLFFVTLARFRGFALVAVDGLATCAAACFFLGNLALFRLANPRIGEGMGAGGALFFGQRAQHDAGRLRFDGVRLGETGT